MIMTFHQLKALAVRRPPTKQHRAAAWECMLGTIYARNPEGEVQYFDYDWDAAGRFIGDVTDVRVARAKWGQSFGRDGYPGFAAGKWVWWVRDEKGGAS